MTNDQASHRQSSEAVQTMPDFLANMRHELRSPLNAIMGYSELWLEDTQALGHRGFSPGLEKIRVSGQHLLTLINDLLDPAKLAADQSKPELTTPALEGFGERLRHQLGAPLSNVFNQCELLLSEAAKQDQEDFIADLQKIHAAGQKLRALMDECVGLTQIEAGQHGPDLHPPGLATVIGEMAAGGSVLVVDDNDINRDVLSRRLQRQGHSVAVAENGAEALQMIEARQFDLVLLDIVMPEMNGYQVLERLKADGRWREIPVIMISALDELESIVRCIELGAEDYLPKPFNSVLLRARIGACLEKKRLREAQLAQQRAEEERIKREWEMAAKVQQRLLLERPPEIAGLELAGTCFPIREVGGDYYDFIDLDDCQLGLAVADVAGKGLPAALLASTVQASLRSQARQSLGHLPKLIASLNDLLHSWTESNKFVTLFYAQFDIEQRLLRYVNAGHNPPLLLRPGAAAAMSQLGTGGLPLGIFQGVTYTEQILQMQIGDVLVAYTDGVTDALNPENEEFDEARLQAVITAGAHLSANELIEKIVASVHEWCRGVPQTDDLTVLVMKLR